MAVTLKFMCEDGRIRAYKWHEYPMVVAWVHPQDALVKWYDTVSPPLAQTKRVVRVVVHCGPEAPYPAQPTADELWEGHQWLSG